MSVLQRIQANRSACRKTLIKSLFRLPNREERECKKNNGTKYLKQWYFKLGLNSI